jgi:hypothetical protein
VRGSDGGREPVSEGRFKTDVDCSHFGCERLTSPASVMGAELKLMMICAVDGRQRTFEVQRQQL